MRLIASFLLASLATAAAADSSTAWRDRIDPAHVSRVDDADGTVASMLASAPDDDPAAKADVSALMDAARRPVDAGTLAGDWRCRSLQGSEWGVFVYPWFKCRISGTPAALQFAKLTGSQRRQGTLHADGDAQRLVFIGASTVNDDPNPGYSFDPANGRIGEGEADSVGVLYRLAPKRLLMVLDATADRGFELYELTR